MLKEHDDSSATAFPPNGYVYENPSADKFAPPPSPSEPRSHDKLQRGVIRTALGLAVYFAADGLQMASRDAGWWAGFSAVVLLAASVFEYVIQRHADDEDKDPYSPPTNITR